ncbi:MAG: ketopantoate reductase family protein [Promethearchaeota archaeon]
MRLVFLGAGSIGCLFGGYLASSGHQVTLVGRQALVDKVYTSGLAVRTPSGETLTSKCKAVTELPRSEVASVDFVFVTVKTHANSHLISQYGWLFEQKVPTVIIQNGMGNENEFIETFPDLPVVRVLTSNGALLSEPGVVTHTGFGVTEVGVVNGGNYFYGLVKELAKELSSSGIETKVSADITVACWRKMFVNVGINPFGAISGLSNGELLKVPHLLASMKEAVREAVEVARLDVPHLPREDYIKIMLGVAEKTAKNRNSMLQDIDGGKQTEIDSINGYVVKLGEKYNHPTPVNSCLVGLVKGIERKIKPDRP